jgi:DNA-binding response OmpR family regulator
VDGFMSKSKVKYSILIVDDNESSIAILTKILSPDYSIISTDRGEDGISTAKTFLPDVILLDIMMDGMDGYEVITALKKSEKTKNIPVLFITSLDSEGEEEKGLLLGASDYIIKPYSPPIVKLRIKNQINMLEQLSTIENQIENIKLLHYENVNSILKTTPYSCYLLNKDFQMLDCNQASMDLFKVESKEYFIERFLDFSPKYQPDGMLSVEKAIKHFKETLDEGESVFEFMHNTIDGTLIPCEIFAVRVTLQSDYFVMVYIKDLREHKAMMEELDRQGELLYTVNSVAGILLHSSLEEFVEDMQIWSTVCISGKTKQ